MATPLLDAGIAFSAGLARQGKYRDAASIAWSVVVVDGITRALPDSIDATTLHNLTAQLERAARRADELERMEREIESKDPAIAVLREQLRDAERARKGGAP